MNESLHTVGLFGTCGKSTWRDEFIDAYTERKIPFFNPQLPEGTWTPGCIKEENKNLAENGVILFPVTEETIGQGSLAEIGFSIQAAIRRNPQRYFIFYIHPDCTDATVSEEARQDSIRSRKLVMSKLIAIAEENDGVFIAESLEQMLMLSIDLQRHLVDFLNIKAAYSF